MNEAVGEVMAIILPESQVNSFRRRMRLARRVVGTQLGMFADDACLARHVLVAFDLALSTRIAGLYSSRASAHVRGAVALPWLNAPGPVAQFGNPKSLFFQHAVLMLLDPHQLLFCMSSHIAHQRQQRTLYSRAFRFRLRISSTSALGGVSCINPFGALELCWSLSSSMVEARGKVVRGLVWAG
jgi:hypothetical protein